MADGGVFAQWLHTYEMDPQSLAAIIRAFSRHFPDYILYSTNVTTTSSWSPRKGGALNARSIRRYHISGAPAPFGAAAAHRSGVDRASRSRPRGNHHPILHDFRRTTQLGLFPDRGQSRGQRAIPPRRRQGSLPRCRTSTVPLLEMLDGSFRPMTRRVPNNNQTLADLGAEHAFILRDTLVGATEARAALPMRDLDEIAATMVRQWATDCKHAPAFVRVLPRHDRCRARGHAFNPSAPRATEAWALGLHIAMHGRGGCPRARVGGSSRCRRKKGPDANAYALGCGAGVLAAFQGSPSAMSEYAFLAKRDRNDLPQQSFRKAQPLHPASRPALRARPGQLASGRSPTARPCMV